MAHIGHIEREHIRNAYGIIEDMRELTQASLKKNDCEMIEDVAGAQRAHSNELHKAFVLYAHVVDYLEDCEIIDRTTRHKLVHEFSDFIDMQEHPTQGHK